MLAPLPKQNSPSDHSKTVPQGLVVGWREWIALPSLGIGRTKAKIDTGARTSALHAVDLVEFKKGDVPWVRFSTTVPNSPNPRSIEAPLIDMRPVKNTSGIPEMRHVIRTTLALGPYEWLIQVTLANREKMEFGLILGRTALRRHRILVDPSKSFLIEFPLHY